MVTPKPQSKSMQSRGKVIIWKFILTYILLMGFFLLLIGLEPVKNIIDINGLYSGMIVKLTAAFLNIFDLVQGTHGSILSMKRGLSLDVKFGCNGLEAFLIYAIAILSFPANKWQKLAGIGIGFIGLQVINILRIALLAVCGIYFREIFHYVHIYIAQGVMIAVAVIFFLKWLNYATKSPNPA